MGAYDIYDIEIDQGGAGTTELLAAAVGQPFSVVSYFVVLSGAGTFAFSDGTTWFTGDIPIAANGGVAESGSTRDPLFTCGRGKPLRITTVGASAHGRVRVQLV